MVAHRQRPELGKVSEEGSHTNVFERIIVKSSRVGSRMFEEEKVEAGDYWLLSVRSGAWRRHMEGVPRGSGKI